MKLVFDAIELSPFETQDMLAAKIAQRYAIPAPADMTILRKSLDARDKHRIVYRFRVLAEVPDDLAAALLAAPGVKRYEVPAPAPLARRAAHGLTVIIVGSGPAGLFCALRLIAAGARVEILERGAPVEERLQAIHTLQATGVLDPESNVLFGEGGAGTYSDGKLTTRIHKPEVAWVFQELVACGAPASILSEQKPHLGTDRLVPIIRAIRGRIEDAGSRLHFHAKVTDLLLAGDTLAGVTAANGSEYRAAAVVLATGHSARDVYTRLHERGIALAKKGFAVGLRAEHPAELINAIQYGRLAQAGVLPTAEYALAFNNPRTGRSVYSFCMCPGGEVINSSSEEARLCINGMSNAARDGRFSNAALVVTVGEQDLPAHPLAGLEWQRALEEQAFAAGGSGFRAPAQRITAFLSGRGDTSLPPVSYRPGVTPARHDYLPPWMTDELKNALPHFNNRMRGFVCAEGVLIGVETRTSSPVRIVRGDDMQSVSLPGLYPVGEGAGYAGGIVSSAVDGVRAADMILMRHGCPAA